MPTQDTYCDLCPPRVTILQNPQQVIPLDGATIAARSLFGSSTDARTHMAPRAKLSFSRLQRVDPRRLLADSEAQMSFSSPHPQPFALCGCLRVFLLPFACIRVWWRAYVLPSLFSSLNLLSRMPEMANYREPNTGEQSPPQKESGITHKTTSPSLRQQ